MSKKDKLLNVLSDYFGKDKTSSIIYVEDRYYDILKRKAGRITLPNYYEIVFVDELKVVHPYGEFIIYPISKKDNDVKKR